MVFDNGYGTEPDFEGPAPSGYTYEDNLEGDPRFVSSTDWSLQSSSPAVDAGVDLGLPYLGDAPDLGWLESY